MYKNEKFSFKLMISVNGYTEKPTSKDYNKISFEEKEITISELEQFIKQGYIFSCTYIDKEIKSLFGYKKKERTVIHLYIKENDTHHYFGSIANVFEYFSPDILGISYGSLRNYGLSNEKTFQNSKCIIRKGTLLSKSGNRGKK